MMQVKMGMTIDQLCRESWLDREDCIVIAYFIIVSYLFPFSKINKCPYG